jgi:hypothetical protein
MVKAGCLSIWLALCTHVSGMNLLKEFHWNFSPGSKLNFAQLIYYSFILGQYPALHEAQQTARRVGTRQKKYRCR